MEISIAELQQFTSGPRSAAVPFDVGKGYLFRTPGYHAVGIVTAIVGDFLVLRQASWVADTGKFSQCAVMGLADVPKSEVEFVGDGMCVNATHITDAIPVPTDRVPSATK